MRAFYLAYHTNPKLQPLAAEVSRSHNVIIIGAAAYQTVSSLPKEYQGQLPAPEQIARRLQDVE